MLTFETTDPTKAMRTVNVNGADIMVYDMYVGAVLELREYNARDDSDFYAVCWDDEQRKPVRVDTWSTRFAKPYLVEKVDATPEVLAKYAAWRREQERRNLQTARNTRAEDMRLLRSEVRKAAAKHGFPYVNLLRVRRRGGYNVELGKLVRLLLNAQRSSFKKGLQAQVIKWCKEPNKYPSPLSQKQLSYLNAYGFREGSQYSNWGARAGYFKDGTLPRWRG